MQTAGQPQGQRIGARRRIAGPVQNAVGNRAFARIIGQQPQHACWTDPSAAQCSA